MNTKANELKAQICELRAKLDNPACENREAVVSELREATASLNAENAMAAAERENKPAVKTKNEQMREVLNDLRSGQKREFVFGGTTNSVEDGGAQNLTVHDLIPTLNEGLGLPSTLRIQTGVIGNEIWPVSINDVEMEEVGENDALTGASLDLDKITVTPKRSGLAINISNKAIDQASFDVMAFVSQKYSLALAKYLAKKVYSQAAWDGIKGPFSGLTAAGTITLADGAYAAILKAVAAFTAKGFTGTPVLVMDATTEADLKATPKAAGQGGFIIENGKCAGYDYVVTHYINTTLSGTSLVDTTDKYIGIGYFEYLAVEQHGEVRMTQDNSSAAISKLNMTNVTLNTEYSITDLSVKLNKKGGTTTQAFALYKIA